MTHEPALRLDSEEIEDQIISELLDRALGRGWGVSVYDGEEVPLRRSHDKAAIIAAMRSTDSDQLHFKGVDGANLGCIVLIYGNGEDLISDHTDNGPMAALAEQVNAVFTPAHDGDDYADRAAWQAHRAMTGGR